MTPQESKMHKAKITKRQRKAMTFWNQATRHSVKYGDQHQVSGTLYYGKPKGAFSGKGTPFVRVNKK